MSQPSPRLSPAERLHAVGVHNAYGLLKAARAAGVTPIVMVFYRAADTWNGAAWQVLVPGLSTNPNSHWSDHGNMTFMVFDRCDKGARLAEAQAWASIHVADVSKWVKIPGLPGYSFPSEVAAFAKDLLKSGITPTAKEN